MKCSAVQCSAVILPPLVFPACKLLYSYNYKYETRVQLADVDKTHQLNTDFIIVVNCLEGPEFVGLVKISILIFD